MKYVINVNEEGERIMDEIMVGIKENVKKAKEQKMDEGIVSELESLTSKDKWLKATIRDILGRQWASKKMSDKQEELKIKEVHAQLGEFQKKCREEYMKLIKIE